LPTLLPFWILIAQYWIPDKLSMCSTMQSIALIS
jgi:hypothetical protein